MIERCLTSYDVTVVYPVCVSDSGLPPPHDGSASAAGETVGVPVRLEGHADGHQQVTTSTV